MQVIESISDWANDKARENPGCVERFHLHSHHQDFLNKDFTYYFLIKTINNKTFITNTFLNQDLHNQDFSKSKLPNKFTKDHVCHHKIGLIRKDPRFVCETYKTGETMNGLPYLAMSLTK